MHNPLRTSVVLLTGWTWPIYRNDVRMLALQRVAIVRRAIRTYIVYAGRTGSDQRSRLKLANAGRKVLLTWSWWSCLRICSVWESLGNPRGRVATRVVQCLSKEH